MAACAVALLAGCGGGGDKATDSAPAPTPAAAQDRCEAVPAALLAKLNSTLTGGTSMTAAAAVKSMDYERVWFVAGALTGPGVGNGKKVVFSTNSLIGSGLTYGVGGFAHEFSDLGHGEDTKAKMSQSDDGYDQAQDCL